MSSRICNVCLQEFPRTAEFWNKQPRRTDGLDETCKACAKKRARDWYVANRERALITRKEYRERDPEKTRERRRIYREANFEKVKAAETAWKAANVEKRIAYTAQWRLDNPEKAAALRKRDYENNIERIKQRARDWNKANPERVRARHIRRKALSRRIPGDFTGADVLRQFDRQERKCFYCRKNIADKQYEIDHLIPLSKGGTNFRENIVLACPRCNNAKRTKMPLDFIRIFPSLKH